MIKVQFIGRLIPSLNGNLAFPATTWTDIPGRTGLEATFTIRISGSVVNVEVVANRCEPSDRSWLLANAYRYTQTRVDLITFASGVGFAVILETAIDEGGMPNAIIFQDLSFRQLCTAYTLWPIGTDFAYIDNLATTTPLLGMAINDLAECLSKPDVAYVNCGRVIDSIRRIITPHGTASPQSAWQAMHKALNISRDYQEFITRLSSGPRHGERASAPIEAQMEVARRTWQIMNRFLEYKKRGDAPLTDPDFPMLS